MSQFLSALSDLTVFNPRIWIFLAAMAVIGCLMAIKKNEILRDAKNLLLLRIIHGDRSSFTYQSLQIEGFPKNKDRNKEYIGKLLDFLRMSGYLSKVSPSHDGDMVTIEVPALSWPEDDIGRLCENIRSETDPNRYINKIFNKDIAFKIIAPCIFLTLASIVILQKIGFNI